MQIPRVDCVSERVNPTQKLPFPILFRSAEGAALHFLIFPVDFCFRITWYYPILYFEAIRLQKFFKVGPKNCLSL